jgi:DNA (cytosine-5)-methyltransferase 1
VDQNRRALAAYRHNFTHPVFPHALESAHEPRWRRWSADLWWMSPPCPPYTRRGLGGDLDDPRTQSFKAILERIAAFRPRYVAFENVPGFVDSRAHDLLTRTLGQSGYAIRETLLCPTELGLPNRRERFYLVAGLDELVPWPPRSGPVRRLSDVLDPAPAAELWCDPSLARRYSRALHIVDPRDARACAACFTAAYGRSIVRSGSYLATDTGLRRFSPAEILRLLDFPDGYRLPPNLALRSAWPLVGNSVSVRAVRWVLAALPGLGLDDSS